MSDPTEETKTNDLVFEFPLDAPPAQVWRAISIQAFREQWLPDGALADTAPLPSSGEGEIRYRLRDDEPPFLESVVTFQVRPDADGGSTLRIVHAPPVPPPALAKPAANDDVPRLMRAA